MHRIGSELIICPAAEVKVLPFSHDSPGEVVQMNDKCILFPAEVWLFSNLNTLFSDILPKSFYS